VASVLEADPQELSSGTELSRFDLFDSVSVLTLMVELDEKAGIKMSPSDAKNTCTFGDIEKLAERQGIPLED